MITKQITPINSNMIKILPRSPAGGGINMKRIEQGATIMCQVGNLPVAQNL